MDIKSTPQRIVSLSPGNTEIVYALGLQDKLVGVTTYCNYPPEAQDKPKVSEFSNVDIEKIVSLNPDLILADSIHKAEAIPALEKLGFTVLALDPPNLESVINDIQMIGEVAGNKSEADNLVSILRERVEAVTAQTEKASLEKLRAFYLTWHDPLWTAGSGTLIDDLITKAGGINIAADLQGHSQITLEAVIERDPQIIFVTSSMGDQDTSFNYVNNEPRFKATEALRNSRVYRVDADIFSRTTPRSVDGLEQLARLMHPEIFK